MDVTPAPGGPYLSYYPRQTPFQGVHDRLYARALAVEGPAPGRRPAGAVVALDSLGLSRDVLGPDGDYVATVRAEVERRSGIPAGNVLLAASHAHSTPQTHGHRRSRRGLPGRPRLAGGLAGQIAEAVATGLERPPPGALRGATGLCPGVAWNRRILTRDGRLVRLAQRPPDDQVVKEPRRRPRPPLLPRSDATSLPGIQGTGGGR